MRLRINSRFDYFSEVFSKHKINEKCPMRFFEFIRSLIIMRITSLERVPLFWSKNLKKCDSILILNRLEK